MEADCDELQNDLLNEVQCEADEKRYQNLVRRILPVLGVGVTVDIMIFHRWKEGDLNGQPPKEQGCRKFKLLAHVSPFLGVVREETRNHTDWPW